MENWLIPTQAIGDIFAFATAVTTLVTAIVNRRRPRDPSSPADTDDNSRDGSARSTSEA